MSKTKFFQGVQYAWSLLQKGLFRRLLEGEVVLNRQPLIWNPLFANTRQHMLGERTRLAWSRVAEGPARSWASWSVFCSQDRANQQRHMNRFRGGRIMFNQIAEASWGLTSASSTYEWWGGGLPPECIDSGKRHQT